jgi:pimeloyl-ACP methyl ester carboxylesterase
MPDSETVVLVHGLWMKGPEMVLLRRRLQRAGYRVYQFSYRSVARDLGENARCLNAFLRRVEGETVHLVAHSLGGLVVRRLFHDFPVQRPGRIVTLGSPHSGSYVADRMAVSGFFRHLLGRSLSALTGELYPWQGQRELGSIAGILSFGVGMLLRKMPSPNDGTVTVVSTCLPNMSDHVALKASHMGLLFSRKVSEQVIAFLSRGSFDHDVCE